MKLFIIYLMAMLSATSIFSQQKVIKQGHRGCRGLLPENSITGMKRALDLGSHVLELDVVISKDQQVVVSHDPYFTAEISMQPNGDTISAADEKQHNLYKMNYSDIKKYDVGSKHNTKFPEQVNFPTYKPLLSELIDSVDAYARSKGMPAPYYNIEIKSQPKTDDEFQPKPEIFTGLVMKVCKKARIMKRMNIQSFDVRPLQLIHKQYPDVTIAYLTANQKTIAENISDLGFQPHVYSPYYKTVDEASVQYCHEKGMKIIPWTVNTKQEIDALIGLKVDGIITDYPNLF